MFHVAGHVARVTDARIARTPVKHIRAVYLLTEHRQADNQDARCAIVESGPLMQLLFLNNNFHIVHHTHPSLSWYEIPGTYYRNRDYWIAKTQGHWFSTYWDVLRRCAFTAKDSPRFSDQA